MREPSIRVYDLLVVFALHVGIGLASWANVVLSLNRFEGPTSFRRTDLWSLLLLLHASVLRYIAAVAMRIASVWIQLTTAVLSTVVTWTSFVVIFNRTFSFPTRQQWVALVMTTLATVLWEVSTRVVVRAE